MHARRVIPCLDVTHGRVVKGVKFVELRDAGDPVEIAQRYDEQGADELTLLDITATTEGSDLMLPVIQAVAARLSIPLTVGGGVHGLADIGRLLDAGADKVGFNSAAIANPQLVSDAAWRYGSQRLVVAIDAGERKGPEQAERGAGWDVYSYGGQRNAGRDVVAWAREVAELGAGEILLTSIDRDGTQDGFDLALTRAVSDAVSVPVIASGGAGTLEHLADGLEKGGADAVLAASVFHFGTLRIAEVKQYLAGRGIAVRL
ncbi:MAG: imidazole glycerol phosphate synthase subunit HisF [Ottowia sp.]|nr:imidazole glycerol phosphate synthase subunit HisF [Ottowia sp.]